MYSFTGRLNYFFYNCMWGLAICALLNHLQARFGFMLLPTLGEPVVLNASEIKFAVQEIDLFIADSKMGEEIVSFSFDLSVDLTPLEHWNTNNVFLVVMC